VRQDATDLLPIALDSNSVTVKDPKTGKSQTGVYGVSDQLTCVALYYNKDMYAEAGIEAPPTTLEELVTVSRKLTDKSKGRYAIGLNNSLWWSLPFLYLHGGDAISPDNQRATLDEAQAIQAFTFLRQLYQEGMEGGAWRAGAINPDQGFINGKYAMVVGGPWNLQAYKSVNYGVTLLPGQGTVKSATNIGGTSMIVLENSKRKKAAYEFLRYLTSFEAQSHWAEKTGQISVNKKVNEARAPTLSPAVRAFSEQLMYAQPRPRLPNYDQLENVVNPLFYSVLDGKLTPEEGLKQATKVVNEEILAVLKE